MSLFIIRRYTNRPDFTLLYFYNIYITHMIYRITLQWAVYRDTRCSWACAANWLQQQQHCTIELSLDKCMFSSIKNVALSGKYNVLAVADPDI